MFDHRLTLFAGHFGSGKTEVSVNYALQMAETVYPVCLLDMDIVNPYFRSADAKSLMEKAGIQVILPIYANTNVDAPALGGEVEKAFADKQMYSIFDIGGDDLGAMAVSRYKDAIEKEDYALYFVVNTRRPMTDTPQKIADMFQEIADSARLRPTGIINNTNVLEHTRSEDVIEGGMIINRASEQLGCPVVFTSVMENVYQKGWIQGEVLVMGKYISLPW